MFEARPTSLSSLSSLLTLALYVVIFVILVVIFVILILIVVDLPDACALLTARRQDQRPRRLLHRPGRCQVLGQDQVYRG